ncbi:MAG: phosphatase PAP2 family protein [Candidatus Stahlbacteria bacterium]|nr:phosphatase PAP2 family protein [Candidatus Stahlbacteria bacterium]
MYSDTKYTISSPTRWNRKDWLECGIILGATAGIMTQDEQISEWSQEQTIFTSDKVMEIIESIGSESAIIALGGAYLIGCVKHNEELKKSTLLCGESAIISTLITYMFKALIGRARPDKEEGAYSYSPFNFSGDYWALPSGHTSLAFSIASCLTDECKNPYISIPSYLLATMIGLSRIYDNKHWASKTIAKLHKKESPKTNG